MRAHRHTSPQGARQGAPLLAFGDWNRFPEISALWFIPNCGQHLGMPCGQGGTGMTEPNVPLTYVACRACGSMNGIHSPICGECGTPLPQHIAPWPDSPVECDRCEDSDVGPWLVRDGRWLCETCDDQLRRAS